MTRHATATFEIKSWDEKPYDEGEGLPKLTRASVVVTYSGHIEGEGKVEYLMAYREDGSASYVCHERVTGRLRDVEGTFVLEGTGVFEDGQAKTTLKIVPGSGTGKLAGLSGEGRYVAHHNQPTEIRLDYELE